MTVAEHEHMWVPNDALRRSECDVDGCNEVRVWRIAGGQDTLDQLAAVTEARRRTAEEGKAAVSRVVWSQEDGWVDGPPAKVILDDEGRLVIVPNTSTLPEHTILVAFTVHEETFADAQRYLMAKLKPVLDRPEETWASPMVESWWIAEDERYDGSPGASAVFVTHPGTSQEEARQRLVFDL